MTLDYDERSTLATFKNYFGLTATVAISPTLVLVAYFGGWFENADFGWSCTLAIYMIVALIFIFILWRTTKGYERHREEGSKFSVADIKEVFKTKPTRFVMAIFAIAIFANTINYSLQVYYYSYYAQLSEARISTITLVFGVASVFGAWVVDMIMKHMSKKAAWVIAIGSEAVVMIIMIGFIITPSNAGVLVYVLAILMAVGNAGVYQVPWAMIPDCVDVTELASGKRIDGIVFGIVAFVQKFAGALGAAVLGSLLTAIGYVEGAVQTAETLNSLKYLYGFLVGGLYLVSVLVILKYPLSKKKQDRVREAIAERNQGKGIDMTEFKDLV